MAALDLFLVSAGFAAPAASNAPVGEETSVPYGWVDFCRRYSGECANDARAPRDVNLTEDARRRIARINDWVNHNIAPVADKEHFGSIDQWDYPGDRKGDCEDYALLKRRMLIEAGFPREALLMTVVKDKNGDGHSVLTVKTNRGDYVLD
ncbi:MAG: transglutaminase-like cysteine peptidase, partial [Methylocystis sp.]|nr:transglutaminase-like cysteine peptidase [Methylocystis sp.]